jgi:glycosyltransferase involved in cell wall biosynthesis
MKKIIVYSDVLYPPFDEGIRKTAYQILKNLEKQEVNVLGLTKEEYNSKSPTIKGIKTNRLLFSRKLSKEIKQFSPDAIIYIPGACGTLWSFIRGWVLKRSIKNKKLILILLQPRTYSKFKKFIISFFKPYKVLTPSERILDDMRSLHIDCDFLPLGVDIDKFKPIKNDKLKSELGDKYKIPKDKFIILHVGHINEGRNLEELIQLQNKNYQVVIVGSTSTPTKEGLDFKLKNKLEIKGIIVNTEYIDKIEEFYQLSDAYVFPVESDTGVISIPLSILEAMGCNLPVVTRKTGTLLKMFKEDRKAGFIYYHNKTDLMNSLSTINSIKQINTRKNIIKYTWENTIKKILDYC